MVVGIKRIYFSIIWLNGTWVAIAWQNVSMILRNKNNMYLKITRYDDYIMNHCYTFVNLIFVIQICSTYFNQILPLYKENFMLKNSSDGNTFIQ